MDVLRFRPGIDIEDLEIGDCTIRETNSESGVYLRLWFRDVGNDGKVQNFGCPVNPGGSFGETPRRTWGLNRTGTGIWQVSPSINVLVTGDVHPGAHPTLQSLWHKTPALIGVPEPAPWQAS